MSKCWFGCLIILRCRRARTLAGDVNIEVVLVLSVVLVTIRAATVHFGGALEVNKAKSFLLVRLSNKSQFA